ncbi:hypothetical protein JCM1840_002130 [Sporobolomyces johnsonii]
MPSSPSPPPHDPTPSLARSLSPPFSLHSQHDLFAYSADHGTRTGMVSPPNLHELSGEALFGRSPLSPATALPPAPPPVDYTTPPMTGETALPASDPAFVQREREARKKLRERYMVSLSGNEKLEKMLQVLKEGVEYAAMIKEEKEKGRRESGEDTRWKADGENRKEGGRADAANQQKSASPSKQTARGESQPTSPSRQLQPKLPLIDSVKAQSVREGTPPLTPPATTSLLDSPTHSITSSRCSKRRENSSTKAASDPRTPTGDMARAHEHFFTASEGDDAIGELAAKPHSTDTPRSSTFPSPGQVHLDAFKSLKLGTTRSPPHSPAYLDSRSPRSENSSSPSHSPPPFSPPFKSRPTSPTSPGTAALADPRSLTPMPSLPSSSLVFEKPRPALFRTLGYDFLPSRSMSRTHGLDDELTEEEKQWAELSRKVRDDGRGRDWWGMPVGFGGNWGKSILSTTEGSLTARALELASTSSSDTVCRSPASSSSDSALSGERRLERRAHRAKEYEELTQIEESIRDSFAQAGLDMPDYESFSPGSNGVRRSLSSMQNGAFSPPPPRPGQPLKPYRRGPFPVPELTQAEKEERRRKRKLGVSPEIDAAPGESRAELRKRAWEEWLLFDQEKQRLVAQLSHEASPNDAQVYNALAKLHLRAPIPSAREFAEQLLVQSLQIDEGQPEIASLLARCIEGRDPKEAIRWYRIALRHDPHFPDHHLNLATALQRVSSPNSAADTYAGLARGFVDSPWEPIALFRLGQLAEDPNGLNDRLRAADAFEKALESLKRLRLLDPSLARPGPWEDLDELERMLLDSLDGLRGGPNERTPRSIDIYNETSLTLDHILAGLQHMSRSTAAAEVAESSRKLAQQVDRSFERMKKVAEEDTLRQNALLKSLEDLKKELTTLPERLVSTARLMAKRPPHITPPPPPPDPIEILLRKLEQARQLTSSA